LGTAAFAGGGTYAAEVSASALQACAALDRSTDRLACYDQLAGRAPSGASVPAPAPAPLAAQLPSTAPSQLAAPAAPGAPPKESFGLYSVEHPPPPKPAATLAAKIAGLGVSANGHPTVSLEGGQLWELADPDPLLAAGDSVTITRATFGSFLMTTPNGRTHRVRRLR
jgi:hypothetical protein